MKRSNILFYFLGFALIFGIKLFYSRAGSDELRWILGPTACWVEILSGIPFEYEPGAGYVNHSLRCLIAPSCAGINFMIILMASLLFPFIHRVEAPEKEDQLSDFWRKTYWTAGSLVFSCFITILVNGLRILAAVYLPEFFRRAGLLGGFLSEERLHTAIGVAVYFVCLLTVYRLADRFVDGLGREGMSEPETGGSRKGFSGIAGQLLVPAFWYFGFTLGLPLAVRIYRGEIGEYGEYAAPVALVGGLVLAVYGLARLAWRKTG